jgi:hypothetical protein
VVRRQLRRGDIFVTRSKTPYELDWKSPGREELDFIIVHLALNQFLAALEAVYPGKADEVEVVDFFGGDEALAYLCFACAEMLSMRVPGKSQRVTALMHLFAAYLVEKYTTPLRKSPNAVAVCRSGSSGKWRTMCANGSLRIFLSRRWPS